MSVVGIRALKQNASAVVTDASNGEAVTITDRGRPVAMLVPIPASQLERLIASGQARPAKTSFADLGEPTPPGEGESSVAAEVAAMRDEERY